MTHDTDSQSAPLMADITDKLDPEVQAELKAAFIGIQKVSAALEAALVRRTELLEAHASRALGEEQGRAGIEN